MSKKFDAIAIAIAGGHSGPSLAERPTREGLKAGTIERKFKEKAVRNVVFSLLFLIVAIAAATVGVVFVGYGEDSNARLAWLAIVFICGSGAAVAISTIVRHLSIATRTRASRIALSKSKT